MAPRAGGWPCDRPRCRRRQHWKVRWLLRRRHGSARLTLPPRRQRLRQRRGRQRSDACSTACAARTRWLGQRVREQPTGASRRCVAGGGVHGSDIGARFAPSSPAARFLRPCAAGAAVDGDAPPARPDKRHKSGRYTTASNAGSALLCAPLAVMLCSLRSAAARARALRDRIGTAHATLSDVALQSRRQSVVGIALECSWTLFEVMRAACGAGL